ncbi:MAG: hypothetical protein ACE5DI_00745 [Candidatus Micrarchaeia archaeon]
MAYVCKSCGSKSEEAGQCCGAERVQEEQQAPAAEAPAQESAPAEGGDSSGSEGEKKAEGQ